MGKLSQKLKNNISLVTYKIAPPEAVNQRELSVLQTRSIPNLLPVTAEAKKKNTVLQCEVSGLLTLKGYFVRILTKKMFLDVVMQLLRIIKQCIDHRMDFENLLFDSSCIFMEESKKTISCIYLPVVNNKKTQSAQSFFQNLPYEAVFFQHENLEYVTSYIQYFKDLRLFSLEHFEKFVFSLAGKQRPVQQAPFGGADAGEKERGQKERNRVQNGVPQPVAYNPLAQIQTEQNTTAYTPKQEGQSAKPPETTLLQNAQPKGAYLIRKKTKKQVPVGVSPLFIGKDKTNCRYCILDNKAISRVHAKIIREDSSYYIVDLNSTNKTCLNGKVIPPQKKVALQNGAKITLADEEFTFVEKGVKQ